MERSSMWRNGKVLIAVLLAVIIGVAGLIPVVKSAAVASSNDECPPTPYDEIGPFYRPNAPVRSSVGQGYLLTGTVRSAEDCSPLPGARIEFWLVNEEGEYDDAHRATVIAYRKGSYSFESNRPVDYVGRLPHIHIRVTADGHEELITQHYPKEGSSKAEFDLILEKKQN